MVDQADVLNKAYDAFSAADYSRAKELFEMAAPENVRAHLYLGWMYAEGLGVNQNSAKSEYHYRCLSDANDADGKYYLAALFQKKGDLQRAVALYEEAAALDHVSGAYWAYALNGERASEPDCTEKANFYLRKAATLGHLFAQRDLAIQQVKASSNVLQKIRQYFLYLKLQIKGLALVMRNSQDPRVR